MFIGEIAELVETDRRSFPMKTFALLLLMFLMMGCSYAGKHKSTWDYPFLHYDKYEVKGSNNFHRFEFDLRTDKDVRKEFENNSETGLISYLLFENGEIVIDESDIPTYAQGNRIIDDLLPSHSIGKSLVSYVTGHAICEGYVSSVNEKLTNWDVVQNTLFQDQLLIDLLNMQAGDDKYVGERLEPRRDNKLKQHPDVNVNTIPLVDLMKLYFQNTNRNIPAFNAKKPKYNYSALTTNVIMNFVIHKTGEDWEKLLHKVFNEHVRVENNVYFSKTVPRSKPNASGRYSFYATRYDYLRIAKAMLDDWHTDTCAGKYLKSVYKGRINKSDNTKEPIDVGLYTKSYGGQFHFDVFGLKKQTIIGMSGFAGQQILIDVDAERIIVVNSLYRNYDWNKIVYDKIKR